MPPQTATGEAALSLPCGPPVNLSVSVVSHFSDPRVLQLTLVSLAQALTAAQVAGHLGRSSVMVVDNSGDPVQAAQLAEMLKHPDLTRQQMSLLTGVPNHGYGSAHNWVIRTAESDFHLILNPDVTMHHDALCRGLIAMNSHPECVMLTPHTTDQSGQRQHVAKAMPGVITLLARAIPRAPAWLRDLFGNARYELRSDLDGSSSVGRYLAGGCFMLCRTKALKSIGGFDERYFMYFEDFDLSIRLAAGSSSILYEPGVAIVHGGGGAASKGARHILWFGRSALRFFKHHGWRWMS